VLFGNPLTVTWTELALQWGLVAVILVGALALDGLLSATTFDPAHARTVGVRVGLVDAALLIGLSLTIVVGLLAVGVLMSLTLAIAPAAGARLLSDSRPRIMAIAVAFGLTAAFGGLLLSYYVSVPTGPLVALVAVAQFACCAVVRRTRRGTRQVLSVPAEAVA
jgi:ABC-type Mn2+/Zn2+ transport system permease subunit